MDKVAGLPAAEVGEASPLCVSTLAREHHDDFMRFLRARVHGSSAEAADVAQESYIRMMQYEGSVQIRSPYYLLLRVAMNVVQDLRRAEQVRRTRQHCSIDGMDLACDAPGPDHRLVQAEQLQRALQAIDDLPPRCREVFLLHRRHHYSYPQIAQICGISIKTVEKHICTALASCTRQLC